MNQVRTFLLFAWLLVGFLMWEAWQRDHALPQQADPAANADAVTVAASDGSIPAAVPTDAPAPATVATPSNVESIVEARAPVLIETDVLRLSIDPNGATVQRAELLSYRQQAKPDAPPVVLLSAERGHFFAAQAGWVNAAGNAPSHQASFSSAASEYRLADGADELRVPFEWVGADGVALTRELVLHRGSYAVEVVDHLRNDGATAWQGNAYRQLMREPPVTAASSGFTNPESYSFVGAAWYSAADKFNKIKFDAFDPKEPLDEKVSAAWIAMLQHYFFAAWIPDGAETVTLSNGALNGRYFIRSLSPAVEIAAGSELTHSDRLYIGPKLQDQLDKVAPGLELSIDYGVFTAIAEPLHWLLSKFHWLTGNWGWSIILLVVFIKALFFKLSETQYKSFAKMRMIQPRIESLKERYGDDRQKFNLAMMELYKKEKINPMGGCLPILVQIPVFISLYWVLLESVELRHAPWMGWIHNLTAPDPFFILPVLNLSTMWLTQKLSPSPGMDPMQKKMMQAMPLVFGVMFAFFPAGLVLYWTVNGGLGLLQQWIINKRHGTPAKA